MMKNLLAAGLVTYAAATAVQAAPTRVQATQDQNVESYFSLDFGPEMGGVSNATITRTDMELELDGASGLARFVNYDQDVDPLTLPGGLSTGALRIRIVPGSSTGTFNRLTGEFFTHEVYSIEFDGDLSAMGLFSPIPLASESMGVVDIETGALGRVTMNWAGGNLANEVIPFDFSYICTLFATFEPSAKTYLDVRLAPLVESTEMAQSLRNTLAGYVNNTLAALNTGNARLARNTLRTFMVTVRNNGSGLVPVDAAELISAASTALELIGTGNPLSDVQNRSSTPTKFTNRSTE